MNYTVPHGRLGRIPSRLLQVATSLFLTLVLGAVAAHAADAAGTGTISGTVTSSVTQNAMQGAAVTLPGMNRTTLTDDAGYFVFLNVPAGIVDLTVSYTGFTPTTERVNVSAGATARLDVSLKSADVVTMEKYTVQSVREGQALSITEQRNATNPKNVMALDEWGVLPTQNVGELLSRMPGVSFQTDEDDLINSVDIRGMVSSNGQSFTRLVVDGMSSTGVGGNGRTATLHSFSAAMYEQIELIAGQTPDKRADSIGGQINLKSRSPLAMKERQRFAYNLGGRYTPGTSARNSDLGKHPLGYTATMDYTGVFDIAGGTRNLGISASIAQQQITTQFDYDVLQYAATTDASTAYFRDYDKRSGANHRFITGLGLRADYRLSPTTTVSARFTYNAGREPFFHYTFINPFASTGIVAGSNSTRAEISTSGNGQMLLTPRTYSFTSNNPTGTLFFEHNFGRLKIDHAWRMSRTHWDSNAGNNREGGQLTLRTKGSIGFILDNSDLTGRVFTQTAGPNVYDPASYTSYVVTRSTTANRSTVPVDQTSVRLDKRGTITNTDEWSGTINATYPLPFTFPVTLKAGADTVNRRVNNFQSNPLRWYLKENNYISDTALMPITTFEENHGGQRLPIFNPVAVSETLNNGKWAQDEYYTASQNFTSSRHFKEMVDAGYLQSHVTLGQLKLVGGARIEKVKTYVWTYYRDTAVRVPAAAGEPDPYKRAAMEYTKGGANGEYTKLFPSIHGSYNVTPNLVARASWSTSYARPDMLQLIPGISVTTYDHADDNGYEGKVTYGNPNMKPQLAKNIDLKLEYYPTVNGVYSVGAFRKNITDYLPASGINYGTVETVGEGPNNGFGGEYAGYQIFRPQNIGTLRVQGVELDFRQRLTFLPGALKGLTVRGNYTVITGKGQFVYSAAQVGFVERRTADIPGLVPRTANLGLQYTYGKFDVSADLSYSSDYAVTNSGTVGTIGTASWVQLMVHRKSLTRLNVGFYYRVRPNATAYLNVNNITEAGPDRYTWVPERKRSLWITPMSINFGVKGTF
ncbi:TonB-dependent receptor [Opitutus sp. ER46]|uniref:TonB-dependent receptor n=1 Tax=Opitutus sp. ER46 TaxID=2161864 RepID=UPI000D301233|nr:TonB-dependent receptor [Opitutus sp. ER46]PTX90991.1 hypothetical protein DB354_20300 [Opitutus sp. ER46]